MWQSRIRVVFFCAAVVALYNDWLLAPLVNPRMSVRYSLISEISARTQVHHAVFQALDITAGLLTLAALPWLWRFLQKAGFKYWQVLFVTVGVIGADSIIDALLPISCAPSVDAGCSLAGTHSLITQAHLVESTLIGIATFVAPLLWWHFCKAKHRFIAQASWWFAVLQVAVGGGILLTRFLHHDMTGALQRVYELSIGAWIASILYVALASNVRSQVPKAEPELQPSQPSALALTYEE